MHQEPKQYATSVRTDSDYDEIPSTVDFAIGESTAREIVDLARLVKERGLYKVEKFDYRATYHNAEGEDEDESVEDARTECDTLNVSDTEFWYSAYIKHTKVEILTERQSVADLAAHFGIQI